MGAFGLEPELANLTSKSKWALLGSSPNFPTTKFKDIKIQVISCVEGTTSYHKSSLLRHKNRYHIHGSQPSITAHLSQNRSQLVQVPDKKDEMKLWNAEYIAEANLAKSSLESEAFKKWMNRLSKRYNVKQLAEEVPMSARTIGRKMESMTKEILETLKSKGSSLAKAGKLALQGDHVTICKSTGEKVNSFLAIIITIRNENFEMVPFPICFEPSEIKTFSAFRNDLRRVLKVKINYLIQNF